MALRNYFRPQQHLEPQPKPEIQTFQRRLLKRLKRAFGPIIPGMLLDLVDFFTAGPIGIYVGWIIGLPLGFWIASRAKLPLGKCIFIGFLAGVYCTLPYTEFIPAGMLIGVYARFLKNPDENENAGKEFDTG